MLARSGYPDHVVAAAILHDVLEDTGSDAQELKAAFGTEVCALVAAVSDDPQIHDEEERKAELRERVAGLGGYASVVYAADKVSKVRELRVTLARTGPSEEIERKLGRHRASLAMLEESGTDRRLVDLLRFELEALAILPPGPDEN